MKVVKYTLLILLSTLYLNVSAQYEYPDQDGSDNNKTEKTKRTGWYRDSKLFFGGVPSLMFGPVTYIELPPYVGYKITPYFWAGIGPLYMYYKDNDWNYESSIYGGKLFTQLFLIKDLDEKIHINLGDLYLYAETNMFNLEPADWDPNIGIIKYPRKWINATLVGGGFRFPIGYRSGFSLNVLWDVTQDRYSPYSNPEIRIGFDL